MLKSSVSKYSNLHLYSSPLGRAYRTCCYIGEELNIASRQIVVDQRLSEHDYGDWEGKTNLEIEHCFPGEQQRRRQDKWEYQIPGGESYKLVDDRIKSWMQSVAENEVNIVVTHDMVSRVIRGRYLNMKNLDMLDLKHPQDVIYLLDVGTVLPLLTKC